ncbi:MAG: hypothetical protein ABEK50_15225 [bacterium]
MASRVSPIQSGKPDGSDFTWRRFIAGQLRGASEPSVVFDETTVPGASLWTGARLWVEAFTRSNLEPGDRIIVCLPEGPAFLQVLLACFWNDYTVVLSEPGSGKVEYLAEKFDARLSIGPKDRNDCSVNPQDHGPPEESFSPRAYSGHLDRTPEIRVFLDEEQADEALYRGYTTRNLLEPISMLWTASEDYSIVCSRSTWYSTQGLVFGLLGPLLSEKIILKLTTSSPELRDLSDTITGKSLCETNLKFFRHAREDTLELLKTCFDRILVSVDFAQHERNEVESVARVFSEAQIRILPTVPDACGGLAIETSTDSFRAFGSKFRTDDNHFQIYSRGVNTVIFDPASTKLSTGKLPRWVDTGINCNRYSMELD